MMNDPPKTDERFRPTPKQIVGGIIALVALVFIFQNTDERTVNFLFWDASAATWIWLLFVFVAGGLVGYMFAVRRAKRSSE